MKKLIVALAACAVVPLFAKAEDIIVTDVKELLDALSTYKSISYVIKLQQGEYDLSSEAFFEAQDSIHTAHVDSSCGKSFLYAQNVRIVGLGEKPEDTKLISDGRMRILQANDPVVVSNITFIGGHAIAVDGYGTSGYGGAVHGSCTLRNCCITNCVADGNGGASRYYTKFYDCEIVDCSAGAGGGAAYEPGVIYRTVFRNNTASGNGGAIYGNNSTTCIYDSVFTNNTSSGLGGAICAFNFASNTVIACNSAVSGGGTASWSKDPETAPRLIDCQVYNNAATGENGDAVGNGGGFIATRMVRGEIYGNYARYGGAAGKYDGRVALLEGVYIHDNAAWSLGGGLYNATASNCVFGVNYCSGSAHSTYGSTLWYSDITAAPTHGGVSIGCTYHDFSSETLTITNRLFAERKNNGVYPTHMFGAACDGVPVCTNCLFVNNRFSDYSSRLWVGSSTPGRCMEIVNCTIVSNRYAGIANYVYNETYPAKVENCVFYDNWYYDGGSQVDISGWESGTTKPEGLRIHNCAYGRKAHLYTDENYFDGPMYKYGANGFPAVPMFSGRSGSEYEPQRRSPLRGLGVVSAGMDEMFDFRGDRDGGIYRRLRDNLCDLGCYQCWIMPSPFAVIVK